MKSEKRGSTNSTLSKSKSAALAVRKDGLNIAPKYSGDADIDDFINDIAPFFDEKSVVYVDVGAYIGEVFFKLLDLNKIHVKRALLIEPNPKSFKILARSLGDLVGVSVKAVDAAISCTPGAVTFRANKSMTKRLPFGPKSVQSEEGIFSAGCCRLDKLLKENNISHVNILKVDVEGDELDVLASAESFLLERRIDVIYIEVGFNREGAQQTYFGLIDSKLQDFGYRVFRIYEQKNEWPTKSPLLRRCNFAYMSPDFASARTGK